ncbi:MAG: endolytic transglycosylase MltG, partial [Pseudomonadota bacterium]
MRHLAANMLSILIVAGLVLVAVIAYGERQFRAPGPLEAETTVVIPRGAGLREASERLEEAGAVADAMLFRLGANYSGAATRLRFGEYRIEAGASMASILDQLVSGDTVSYRVTVAEGLSSWEVVEILRASEVLEGEIEAVPAEGSLAPDTYFVSRGDTRTDVIRRMEAAQTAILAEAWEARAADLPLASPEEVLVLASIVEKETGVASERPQVASVFVNRLRRGMPLQSDPTV